MNNDRGFALVTTLLLLVVLAILIGVSTQWSAMDIKRTMNYSKTRGAFFIADAGIQDVINHMNYTPGGDSPGAAAKNFAAAFASWPAEFTDGVAYQGGTYTVTMEDNNDDSDQGSDKDFTVVVTSTASKRGKSATIEAVLHLPRAKGDAAVVVQDFLDAKGNVSVTTQEGVSAIHSNTETKVAGTVELISEDSTIGIASAVGDCTVNGNSDANCKANAIEIDIPILIPKDFKTFAHYIFKNDGSIVFKGANLTDNIPYTWNNGDSQWESGGVAEPTLKGFKHDAQGWSVNKVEPSGEDQNAPSNYVLYFEESLKIAGGIGGSGNTWETTLISENDIEIKGNAYINNCFSACNGSPIIDGGDDAIANLFLIAGDDLKTETLKADSESIDGIFAALDQIELGGNAVITGFVTSNSYCDIQPDGNCKDYFPYDSNVVNGAKNILHGDLKLKFNGPEGFPVTENKVRVLTWKEYTPLDL